MSELTISTESIANHMLSTGDLYNSAKLALELGITAKVASSKLFNIRVSKKYKCIISPLPNRLVKVIQIDGVSVPKNQLYDLIIFNRPISHKRVSNGKAY